MSEDNKKSTENDKPENEQDNEDQTNPYPLPTKGNMREQLEQKYNVVFDDKVFDSRDPAEVCVKRLKDVLTIYDLKQVEFARKVGRSTTYISAIMNGRKDLSKDFAIAVCNKIGISWEWLLKGQGDIVKNNSFQIVQHLSNINAKIREEDAQFLQALFSHPFEERKALYKFFKSI